MGVYAAGALPLWLALVGCGGRTLIPSDDDSGASGDAGEVADAQDADSGDGTSTGATGDCLYQTCMGLSLCGVDKTCPVGDGCNSCTCADLGGGKTASSCTANSCTCP
jgi:hypothetical protein